MADIGKFIGSAQLLPDEVVTIINNTTYSYTPTTANADDKWYYKITDVAVTPADLISGQFLQGEATAKGTLGTIDSANDDVKFLFIKNLAVQANGSTASTSSVYINLDANATDNMGVNLTDCIEIGPNESLALKINCPVANIHAEAGNAGFAADSSPTITQCLVAAIINDAS